MADGKKKRQRADRNRLVIERYEGPSVGMGRYSDRIAISPFASGDPKNEAMKDSFIRRRSRTERTSGRSVRRRTGARA